MNTSENPKSLEEFFAKPTMTAQQRIEQLKAEKEKAKKSSATSKQNEPVANEDISIIDLEPKLPIPEEPLKTVSFIEKKKKSKNLTYETLLNSFRPKEFDMPRIKRTIYTREDVAAIEQRLLKIIGGKGAKRWQGNDKFNVSLSAFYNFLILSFFQTHKEEIELLEGQIQNTNQ